MIDLLRQLSSIQWQIQAGAVWGKCPPSKRLWCPSEWRPFDKNAPCFSAYQGRNRFKIFQFFELQALLAGHLLRLLLRFSIC